MLRALTWMQCFLVGLRTSWRRHLPFHRSHFVLATRIYTSVTTVKRPTTHQRYTACSLLKQVADSPVAGHISEGDYSPSHVHGGLFVLLCHHGIQMLLRRFLHDRLHVGRVVFGQDALAPNSPRTAKVRKRRKDRGVGPKESNPWEKQQNKERTISIHEVTSSL